MPSSSSTPKLPLWIFFATDAILVGAAIWIARESERPMPEMTALAIAGCVIAGAIAGLVPLVVYYERQKNEMLDDRQRALEALARTVSSSAEQISIAAGGLHEIADIAQKNLKHAEQLPHKLQEKIAEFQAQLANANDAEREELERELEELRAGETERLQSTSDKIARTVSELVKLEAATQGHVTAATEALAKLSFGAAGAIGKAQAAAEQAFNQARVEASRGLGEASGKAVTAIETAKTAAIDDLTRHLEQQLAKFREASTGLGTLVERIEQAAARGGTESPGNPGSTQPVAAQVPWSAPLEPATEAPAAPVVSVALPSPAEEPVIEPPAPGAGLESSGERQRDDAPPAVPTPAPKRSRKKPEPKPEVVTSGSPSPEAVATPEPVDVGGPPAVQAEAEIAAPAEPVATDLVEHDLRARSEAGTQENVPGGHVPPAAPASAGTSPADPVAPSSTAAPAAETVAAEDPSHGKPSANGQTDDPVVEAPRPRARSRRAVDDQPALGLDLGEFEGRPAPTVESVLSSDGATRLIVTAYIGIGNRLFIRGEGPGLSWDKGVPLQFVSIGKWRWETNDATGPVKFKLLKNDEHESVGLGTLSLQPAHQNEVTATF